MKYALVVENSPSLLQASVQAYLDEGWELNGPPFNWRDQSGSYLVQSVQMKYEMLDMPLPELYEH